MNELVAGDMQAAYRTWKPSANYSFQNFLQDWGQNGGYGAIESYKIESSQGLKNGSSAAFVVAVSPYRPFPKESDKLQGSHTHTITLWVDPADQSISFPACDKGPNPTPCA